MSKLAHLDDLLAEYHQLAYHGNPQLFQKLQQVQAWQKARIQRTHQAHFAEPSHHLMAQYFLNRLYGGPDFDAVAQQIERLMHYAHKAESFIPDTAILTGTKGVKLAILAVRLDVDVAQSLLEHYPAEQAIDDEMMRVTYLRLGQAEPRLLQMSLLDDLGQSLDKYMRSFIVYSAFKMCKGVAYRHDFATMYEFMQDGFLAMKPLKSAEAFVRQFTATEREIIARVHRGDLHPFD